MTFVPKLPNLSANLSWDKTLVIRKDIFACLFSIHNTISLSCHEQDKLDKLVHDMINLLYYKTWDFAGCQIYFTWVKR